MTYISPKTRNCALLLLVLTAAIVAVGTNSNLVAADPCTANLSTIASTAPYSNNYGQSVSIQVPVSASCTPASGSGNSLYAVGDAYDTSTSTDLGSVSTVLAPVSVGNMYNGQLTFNLPSTTQGDTLQISVSLYNGQYGQLLTTSAETIQSNPISIQSSDPQQGNNYNSQNSNYPSQNSNYATQNGNYGPQNSNYATQNRFRNSHRNNGPSSNNYQYQQQQTVTITQPVPFVIPQDNTWLIDSVIAVIIAIAVVGAIAFAIVASRNRQPQPRRY